MEDRDNLLRYITLKDLPAHHLSSLWTAMILVPDSGLLMPLRPSHPTSCINSLFSDRVQYSDYSFVRLGTPSDIPSTYEPWTILWP